MAGVPPLTLIWQAFRPDCVRFLRALLLDHSRQPDHYDPEAVYGDGPPHQGVLRADAPPLCLLTNLGHLVTKLRPGETKLKDEAEARREAHS